LRILIDLRLHKRGEGAVETFARTLGKVISLPKEDTMGVTVETVGSAAVVTLRWPGRRNALGPATARQVADAISEASQLPAHALVLTGEGAFCAGGDLPAFAEVSARLTPVEIRTHVYGDVQAIVRALRDAPMPTIAAVDGAAVGLGMDLALACDMRFVGAGGWLLQGWAKAGLISATGGTWFLERLRPGALWPMLAQQQRLPAARCVELGLAEVSEPSAMASALRRGDELSSIPRDVLAAYVQLARTASWPSEEYLDRCADYQSEFIGGERFRELGARLLGRTAGE
jgi:enoyl-CoA hydratase/carnithine racemase